MARSWRGLQSAFSQPSRTTVTDENLFNVIAIESGVFDPEKLTLFAIFRDEIYFCAAFFDHYRRIGVRQFLILDDRSTDGTGEFLRLQPDCVTLGSTHRFGDKIWYRLPSGEIRQDRAGIAFKTLIPHRFLQGKYGLYVDADEFLILPNGVESLAAVISNLQQASELSVVGPVVEFFPAQLPDKSAEPLAPGDFSQLVAENPFFETTPLVEFDGNGDVNKTGRTKSEKLFEEFAVNRAWSIFGLLRKPTSPRMKTPILWHGQKAYRLGSHKASVASSTRIKLPVAHFVFTANFFGKIERAREWKSHAGHAAKYDYYARMVDRLEASGGGMVGPQSQEFRSARDLEEAGHLVWPRAVQAG